MRMRRVQNPAQEVIIYPCKIAPVMVFLLLALVVCTSRFSYSRSEQLLRLIRLRILIYACFVNFVIFFSTRNDLIEYHTLQTHPSYDAYI